MTAMATACAIVVNWNGWRDTVGCLESLLALEEAPAAIVVCDNGSTDASLAELAAMARCAGPERERVTVLPLPRNLGYAGGLNAGISWAQEHKPAPYYWLLNNDLHACPGALRELLAAHGSVPDAGLCGSVLLDWEPPSPVQAIGGRYSRWLAVGRHLKDAGTATGDVCLDIDYPVGASLLVSSDYLARVGAMEDGYFLYYEEIDWVERGRRLGFRPLVALRSRLRHKHGASTGSGESARGKSMLSEHYGVVNRLRVTRRLWPACLPVVWASLWLVVADRLAHREARRALLVLRLMFSPRLWWR